MDKSLKKIIVDINKGTNLEYSLNEFTKKVAAMYYNSSAVKLALNYYTFYEKLLDEENTELSSIEKLSSRLHDLIEIVTAGDWDESIAADAYNKIEALRNEITERTDALTSYTDHFRIYEYILKRIELRYADGIIKTDDNAVVDEIIQYFLATGDSSYMNLRIKEVFGQLPVRITKDKYFEMLSDSLSLYKDASKKSLDRFLYSFRSSAMLRYTEGMETYFADLTLLSEEFKAVDYKNLSQEEYQKLIDKLEPVIKYVYDVTDLYLTLQELVNDVYTLVLTRTYAVTDHSADVSLSVVKEINQILAVGELYEIPEQITEKLEQLEGQQEITYSEYNKFYEMIEFITECYSDSLERMNLNQVYQILGKCQRLNENSLFAALEEEKGEAEKVDEFYLARCKGELIQELTQLFKGVSSRIMRGIIANTIEKFPIFFHDMDEVAEYIAVSLQNCRDEAEKAASIGIIREIMDSIF